MTHKEMLPPTSKYNTSFTEIQPTKEQTTSKASNYMNDRALLCTGENILIKTLQLSQIIQTLRSRSISLRHKQAGHFVFHKAYFSTFRVSPLIKTGAIPSVSRHAEQRPTTSTTTTCCTPKRLASETLLHAKKFGLLSFFHSKHSKRTCRLCLMENYDSD